jgi:hypothetical protein
MDFTMKMKFFGPTDNQAVIREINVDLNNSVEGSDILENMDFTIDSTTTGEDDNYTVTTTIS